MKEDIAQNLLQYLQTTQDFMLEQVPQVLQQAIKYEKIATYIVIIAMLGLLIAAGFIFYYFWKHPYRDSYGLRKMSSIMGMYIPGAASAMFFLQLGIAIDRLIKIYIAPKYFLIQLFMEMKQ